ncbi:hypothetical protein NBRC116590_23880 [Pelagimonas sp. KU-00592-HH]|uniref:hypothetical protein n=1 Tax=Pelagimonas sp. KU-00592-HH TaxID=3127651 RepID=UPI0031081502
MKNLPSISEDDLRLLSKLLDRLESTSAPDRKETIEKRTRKPDWSRNAPEQLEAAHRQIELAYKGTTFSKFRKELGDSFPHGIRDDLRVLLKVVESALEDQRQYGTWPPPYFATRVGIVLRKAKRFDLSKRFEAAYAKHVVK